MQVKNFNNFDNFSTEKFFDDVELRSTGPETIQYPCLVGQTKPINAEIIRETNHEETKKIDASSLKYRMELENPLDEARILKFRKFEVIEQINIQQHYSQNLSEDEEFNEYEDDFIFFFKMIFKGFILFILILYYLSIIIFEASTKKFILFLLRETFIYFGSEYPPTSIFTKLIIFLMLLIIHLVFFIFKNV